MEDPNTTTTASTSNGQAFKLTPTNLGAFRPVRYLKIQDLPTPGSYTEAYYRLMPTTRALETFQALKSAQGQEDSTMAVKEMAKSLADTLCNESGEFIFDETTLADSLPIPILSRLLEEISKDNAKEIDNQKKE